MNTHPPIHQLLPCPFCGSIPKLRDMSGGRRAPPFDVICTGKIGDAPCHCHLWPVDSAKEAIAIWNTRAQPSPDRLPEAWETLASNIREIIAAESNKGGSVLNAVDAVIREIAPDRDGLNLISAVHSMIGYCQSLTIGTVITDGYMTRMNEHYVSRLEAAIAAMGTGEGLPLRVSDHVPASGSPSEISEVRCPDGLLPDGETCPRCGGKRGPSGVGGGTWVHY